MAAKISGTLDWKFIWLITAGMVAAILLGMGTNFVCSPHIAAPAQYARDCWNSKTSEQTPADSEPAYQPEQRGDFSLPALSFPVPQIRQSKSTEHCTDFSENKQETNTGVSVCDTRITDWAIAFFTYCLVVVGWTTIKSTEQTTRSLERAFVFLENFEISQSLAWVAGKVTFSSLSVVPQWKNSGSTPTRNLELRVTARQWTGDLPDGHDYFYQDPPRRLVIGPGANEWSEPQTFTNFPAQLAADDEQETVYVWGEATYLDVFDNTPRFTRFCSRMRVFEVNGDLRIQFAPYGEYNRTDHDEQRQ